MAKEKPLVYNMLLNGILKVSSYIFPVIAYPYASRILNPEGIGRVSFATSVLAYFMVLAQLGIPTYGIQVCARIREDKEKLSRTAHELFFINLFMTFISYILFAVLVFCIPQMRNDKALFLVMSTTVLLNTIKVEWLYQAIGQYSYITSRALIFKIAAIPLLFIFVRNETDYIYYGILTVFASQASGILNFFHIRKYIFIKPLGHYKIMPHIRQVFVLFAVSCATMVYTNLDTFMLGMIKDKAETGYYNAAVNIKVLLVNIVTAVVIVLLPQMSRYLDKGMGKEFKDTFRKMVNAIIWLVCPVVIYFIYFARESIMLVSGPAYSKSVIPMQIIMPTVLLIGLTNIIGIQVLAAMGKGKDTLYSVMAGAFVDLILNILFIPEYGAVGAATGTLVAEIVVLIVQYIYIRKISDNLFSGFHWKRLLMACFAGSIAALWIKFLNIPAFIALVLSAMLFFGVYGGILLLWKEPLFVEILERVKDILPEDVFTKKENTINFYLVTGMEMRKDMGKKNYYFRNIADDFMGHWKIVVPFIIICVLAAGATGYKKSNQINSLSPVQQEKVDLYNEQLAAYDTQIEENQNSLDIVAEEIEKLQKYIDNSDYMKLQPANVQVAVAQYTVMNTAIENIPYILSAFTNYLAYGNAYECLEKEYGVEKAEYLRELLSWSTNGNMLNITVVHYDKKQGKEVLETVQAGLESYIPEIKKAQGKFSLKPMKSTFYTKVDNDLTNAQNGKMDTLKNYKASYVDYSNRVASSKSSKAAYIEENTPEVIEAAAPGKKLLVIYIVFGAAAGCVIPFVVFSLRYLFSDRIRSAKELIRTDIPVFPCNNSKKSQEDSMASGIVELNLLVEKYNAEGFYLDLLSENDAVLKVSEEITSAFSKKEISVKSGVLTGDNARSLEDMIEKKYAVIVVKAGKNTYPQLASQLGTCQKFGVPVWGCIVVE